MATFIARRRYLPRFKRSVTVVVTTEVNPLKHKFIALLLIATMALSACAAVGMTTKVDAAVQTRIELGATRGNPAVNDPVTFTTKLTRSDTNAPLALKPVTISHTFNGVRYDDVVNKLTKSNGEVQLIVAFTSPGERYYYATFAGETYYGTSTSPVVTVAVGPTKIALSASTTSPNVNEPVTFTVTFGSGGVRTFNAEFAGNGQFLWSHGADQKITVIFM
jgi:hypothetical protein